MPGALLAEHTGRLAPLVTDDDAALDLEVAVRVRERRRVEPERVVVACHQRRRRFARHTVECLLRRLDRRRPVARAPAHAAQPTSGLHLARRRCDTLQRLVQRRRSLQPHLALCERPGREVDVRVVEARQDAAAAQVDAVGARERRLVRPDAARDPVAGDRERADDGQRRRPSSAQRRSRGSLPEPFSTFDRLNDHEHDRDPIAARRDGRPRDVLANQRLTLNRLAAWRTSRSPRSSARSAISFASSRASESRRGRRRSTRATSFRGTLSSSIGRTTFSASSTTSSTGVSAPVRSWRSSRSRRSRRSAPRAA